MRILADMGISARVVSWLKNRGHDVVHLRDEGLQKLPDSQIFAKAALENRIIFTFDLDFGEIVALSGMKKVSVVLFRLNNTSTPFLIARLETILESVAGVVEKGAVVVIEDARHRIRRLPVGK